MTTLDRRAFTGSVALSLALLTVPGVGGATSFIDPTATVVRKDNVRMGEGVFVAPFAKIAALFPVVIGNDTNIQDSVIVSALAGNVVLGNEVILAHNSTVNGPASIGVTGVCPNAAVTCPSFVSFNAVVKGATIQKDAMVSALAMVAPGVTVPSGMKVLPGKLVRTNAQARDPALGKVAPVVEADRVFMEGVIHVNTSFAAQYPALAAESASNVRGINYDPGHTDFNPDRDLPTLAGVATRDPSFRNRIIGKVVMHDAQEELDAVMGHDISLRADEGEPFHVGSIADMDSGTTFHALEESAIALGNNGSYGFRSVVHGGPSPFAAEGEAANVTVTGLNFKLAPLAVFYKSRAGDNVSVGFKSVVQSCDLASNTVVPDRTIRVCNGAVVTDSKVEW